MPKLISPAQSAFVPGRLISDKIFITHEVLSHFRRSKAKKGCMCIKLDIEKAYDSLNLDFLETIL